MAPSRVLRHRSLATIHGLGASRLSTHATRIVVTGAGGWLGLATLEMLRTSLGKAFARRVICFGSAARTLALREGTELVQHPLSALIDLPPAPTLVLHLAFQTKGAADDLIRANRAIGEQVRAALHRIGAEAVFLASSGAADLAYSGHASLFKRVYGTLKLEDEKRFGGWAAESGKTALIARLFNLSGPYINHRNHYALACFIGDVLERRPIEIRAANRVYRSYVAIEEAMSVALGALTEPGSNIRSFDAVGERVYEMDEVAQCVAETLHHRFGVRRPAIPEGVPDDRYMGDGSAYQALRRRLGVSSIGLADQIGQTARYMATYPESC